MSKTGASPEFERKMKEIGAKYAHMMVPRSNVERPWAEFDFPETPPEEMTAAEKAMEDIEALLDGYSKEWRREIDVVMDLHRIVGAYSVERIGEGK